GILTKVCLIHIDFKKFYAIIILLSGYSADGSAHEWGS
ncbi:MAG: hypothetical protein K0R09_3915, partial [Clostridiales bacterium]|nr:hypothetical protein [Clostridiales bacterium]